ncbi:sigma-70 family RNA polymerase sigma factor [Haloferula chungangensis]|uniref:Sigma-70 family RNA polymerase sigma factor n=1 Tax=Haloferula chungangensis TaxID=1048331 RepID=A0ABW2L868_9BACT
MPAASDESDANQLQEFVTQLTKNQGRIRAFIVSLMPGSPDIGDVLQETNLVLWKSRERFKPGTNFLAWAFKVARLEVLHQRGRSKRHGRILLSEQLLDLIAEEMPGAEDYEAYLHALDQCKSKLSKKQRELIEVRYQPGRSLEQLAVQTGRKASALRVALLRIRTVLRLCVEQSLLQRPT